MRLSQLSVLVPGPNVTGRTIGLTELLPLRPRTTRASRGDPLGRLLLHLIDSEVIVVDPLDLGVV